MKYFHASLVPPLPAALDEILIKLSYKIYLLTDLVITPEAIIVFATLGLMLCILTLLEVALFLDVSSSAQDEQGFPPQENQH